MNGRRIDLRSESGSVYLLALLVLLILTILGLALTLATEGEMQLGRNEELSKRNFYSADTGVAIATAKALVVPDLRSANIELVEPSDTPGLNLRNRIEISALAPVQSGPCNLCQINPDSPFLGIQHTLSVTSTRIGWTGEPDRPPVDPVPLAQERMSVLVSFQPWRIETSAAVGALTDQNHRDSQEAF